MAAFGEVHRDAEADAAAGPGHERAHAADVHRFALQTPPDSLSMRPALANVFAIRVPPNLGELLILAISAK